MLLNSLLDTPWYPIAFDSPLNIGRGICFWLAIALILALAVGYFVCKPEARPKFLRIALYSAVGFALAAGAVLLVLTYLEDGLKLILFLPLLLLILCLGGLALALCFRAKKPVLFALAALSGAAFLATLVCMGVYFSTGEPAEDNWLTNSDVNQLGLYLSAALFVAALVAGVFLLGKNEKGGFDSKSIAYAGICIAISFALSYLRIVKMPQGGSITLASLLPIMLYSYMFGVKKGVFAGFILGLLQAVQDPIILHPAQFILDYPAAFACIGLAGMFARTKKLDRIPQLQFALGAVVAGLARFLSHYLSGCFAFGAFAPEGQPVWLYSLIYQAGYVLPDIAIVIAVGALAFCSPALVRAARKFRDAKPDRPAEAEPRA